MSEIKADVQDHIVKSFLDIIILSFLKKEPSHGYALIADIHTNFDVLLSPGTLYPLLYSLEKKGLISTEKDGRRKNYYLTESGLSQANNIIRVYRTLIKQLIKFTEN